VDRKALPVQQRLRVPPRAHEEPGADGWLVADEVLAKHDENYMPPEVAESLHMPTPARSSE